MSVTPTPRRRIPLNTLVAVAGLGVLTALGNVTGLYLRGCTQSQSGPADLLHQSFQHHMVRTSAYPSRVLGV
jgi:hypothetical protein